MGPSGRARSPAPLGAELADGPNLREGDVIRAPLKVDKRVLVGWAATDTLRLELGWNVTYLSGEPGTRTFLSHGPCCGLLLEF